MYKSSSLPVGFVPLNSMMIIDSLDEWNPHDVSRLISIGQLSWTGESMFHWLSSVVTELLSDIVIVAPFDDVVEVFNVADRMGVG